MKIVAQVRYLIKAKKCRNYRGLDQLKNQDKHDFIYVSVPDFRSLSQKIKGFWKTNWIKPEQSLIVNWVALPVDDLSNYKKGDLIEIDINWKIVKALQSNESVKERSD